MEQKTKLEGEAVAGKALCNSRDDQRRAEVLAHYGSEAAMFGRTERELSFDSAIAPLASWIAGPTTTASNIVLRPHSTAGSQCPWPSNLHAALQEIGAWDRLRQDRAWFNTGGTSLNGNGWIRPSAMIYALIALRPISQRWRNRFSWLNLIGAAVPTSGPMFSRCWTAALIYQTERLPTVRGSPNREQLASA